MGILSLTKFILSLQIIILLGTNGYDVEDKNLDYEEGNHIIVDSLVINQLQGLKVFFPSFFFLIS